MVLTWLTDLAGFANVLEYVLSSLQFHDFVSLVSRIEASSEQYDMFMQLDVNTEGYPIQAGEKFRMVLAPTLHLDGSDVTEYFTVVILFLLWHSYVYLYLLLMVFLIVYLGDFGC